MARLLLPVAVGLVGCIWPLSPALACDPAVARVEASAAWQALRELRSQDFFDAADEISPCPGLDGAERAELLRLQGASAALQKDTERAVRLFSEARALDPAGQLPAREFPPTHPVAKLYRLSAPRVAVVVGPVAAPQTVVIAVSAPALPSTPPPSPAPRRAPLVLAAAEGLGQDAADAYAEQERYRGRQLGLQVAAGGSAALAVGLVGATVSLSW